jgi:hypothetical protein
VGAFKSDISTDIPQYFHFDGQDPNLTIGWSNCKSCSMLIIRRTVVWKGIIVWTSDSNERCLIC